MPPKKEKKIHFDDINFKNLFETSGDAIFIMNKEYFIECNDKSLEMFNVKREDIIGHTPFEFSPDKQPDGRSSKKKALEYIGKAIKGQAQLFEWVHITYDKIEFFAEVSLNAIEKENEIYIQATVRNINEKTIARKKLKNAEARLKKINDELYSQNEEYKSLNEEYLATNEELVKSNSELNEVLNELKRSNELYQKLFHNSPNGTIYLDTEGNILELNKNTLKILGSPSAKETKKINILKFPPLIKSGFTGSYKECLDRNKIISKSTNYKSKWDKKIYTKYSFTPISKGNKIIGVFAIIEDITKQKEYEKQIIESEKKYRFLADNINDFIWVRDKKMNLLFISGSITKVLGYSVEEYKKLTLKDIFTKESYDYTRNIIEKEFRKISNKKTDQITNYIRRYEVQYIHKEGHIIWGEINASFYIDKKGVISGITGVTRDISKRKKAQIKLRESENKFKSIVNNINDLILIFDYDGNILDANNKTINLTKFSYDELLQQKIHKLLNIDYKLIIEKNKKSDSYIFESVIKDKEGKATPVSINSCIVDENKNGKIQVILRNISEQKNKEEELLKAIAKAEESDKLKSAFLANMSHEIRTPLNVIVGFSNMLNKQNITSEKREQYTKQIQSSSDSLTHLIEDIMDLAKIESNQLSINPTQCNIKILFEELLRIFKYELENRNKNHLKIDYDLPDNFNHIIVTDSHRLKQIIINLVTNAIKFTDKGFIKFGYKVINHKLEFYIKDSGRGIPKDAQKIIFERFRKGHDMHGGTGLGLAISKRLIELMNGEITVESEINKGSNFIFTLPLIKGDIKKIDKEYEAKTATEYDWSLKSILIAEDDDLNFMFLEEMLEETKINIIRAKNGMEAVRLFEENIKNINIILMDIQMPIKDGYTTTKEIKKINKDIPVIAQTAYAMPEEKNKSIEAGCNLYIIKPITPDKLLPAINMLLKQTEIN